MSNFSCETNKSLAQHEIICETVSRSLVLSYSVLATIFGKEEYSLDIRAVIVQEVKPDDFIGKSDFLLESAPNCTAK